MTKSLAQPAASIVAVLLASLLAAQVGGQVPPTANDEPRTVELDLSEEIELKLVVDLVSDELGLNILYDEQILNKKVTIRAPGKLRVESLTGVLQSALKMKDLALADAEAPGWKKIIPTAKLSQVAPLGDAQSAIQQFGRSTAVTQVFVLENSDPTQVDQSIKPFLTQPGANSLPLKELNTLIVTDYATNMLKIADLVQIIDQKRAEIIQEIMKLKHVDASEVSQQINSLFAVHPTKAYLS